VLLRGDNFPLARSVAINSLTLLKHEQSDGELHRSCAVSISIGLGCRSVGRGKGRRRD